MAYVTSTEIVTTEINNLILATSTPFFSYYDTNYTGTQPSMSYPLNISQIRLVRFSFFADINPSSSPEPEFFSQLVDIRNLRSN